ncbi:hypothetical protein [Mycetocola sp. 2940]|uniref:SHOCT domain-containing protein n=1 Tax=Mycetocola sp. 2940 TaxID=3156452 RepID=UPI0033992C83
MSIAPLAVLPAEYAGFVRTADSPATPTVKAGADGSGGAARRRDILMINILAVPASTVAGVAMHPGWGPGFGWWFLLIPLFWIVVFALLFAFLGRRWRRSAPWVAANAPGRSAEDRLAERFAQGEIDETEYRARLEVIRANNPTKR